MITSWPTSPKTTIPSNFPPQERAELRRAVRETLDDPRPGIPVEKVKKGLLSWGTDNVPPRPE